MGSEIKTYNSESFRKEYFNASPELNKLFEKSLEDFFCLRIEELTERVLKPILPSREESHTLIYVMEGSYRTKLGFKEYTIQSNQIVVLQAGAVFSTEIISKDVKGYTCHFHPNVLIGKFGNHSLISDFTFLNVGIHPIINVGESAKENVVHVFERLASEFKSDSTPNSNIIYSYLLTLLTELNVLQGLEDCRETSAALQLTNKFRELVNEKVKENLKVADFAKILNVSPNHLNKCVKSITAKPASLIINEAKLIEIKFLLYQSNCSINEISFEMGFLDTSYFSRFFKRYENLSPSKFRELIEKS